MYLKFVFLSFLFLTTNSLANGNLKINDFAVLKSTYTGISTNEKKEVRLERAAIIKIIKIKSKSSLITSVGDPLYGYDNIWVPNDLILQESKFKKIKQWNGDTNLEGADESTYKIKNDGSFIYRSFEYDGTPYKLLGHLYESNGIYWPKTPRNPLNGEVFFRLDNGKICWSVIAPCVSP